jgi:putative photosynthetic complex assembly protein 2
MAVETFALPALITVLVWWLSTGVVLLAARRCPAARRRSGGAWGAALTVSGGFGLAWWSAAHESVPAAIAGFAGAIIIWGWIEYAFLTGRVTGTHAQPCPPDAHGWQRFKLAAGTVIHHELVLAGSLCCLAAISFLGDGGAAHDTAFWTFAVLLVMRLSTKFNLFVGVSNFTDGFLPARLTYLKSYFGRPRTTVLMAVSLAGAAGLVWWWVDAAVSAPSGTASQFGAALVSVLAFLGLVEHGFLMMPVGEAALWRWATGGGAAISSRGGQPEPVATGWRPPQQTPITTPTKTVPSTGQND